MELSRASEEGFRSVKPEIKIAHLLIGKQKLNEDGIFNIEKEDDGVYIFREKDGEHFCEFYPMSMVQRIEYEYPIRIDRSDFNEG